MHSFTMWPVMTLMAGAVVLVPTVPGSVNRSLLYWVVLPPLVAGVIAIGAHLAAF